MLGVRALFGARVPVVLTTAGQLLLTSSFKQDGRRGRALPLERVMLEVTFAGVSDASESRVELGLILGPDRPTLSHERGEIGFRRQGQRSSCDGINYCWR